MRRLAIALVSLLGLTGFRGIDNPVFPSGAWRTLSGLTLTAAGTPGSFAGTVTGTAIIAGRTICVRYAISVTTQSTATVGLYINGAPAPRAASMFTGAGVAEDANVIKASQGAAGTQVFVTKYDNTYVGPTGYSALLSGCYELN